MSNVDVLLETDSVAVIGGPASVTVQTDVGAQGKRGSQIYVGAGLPSTATIPNYAYLQTGDMYVDSGSGAMFQYNLHPAGNQWDMSITLATLGTVPPNWWSGSLAAYNAIGVKNPNTLYLVTS